jgi:PhzF family phenazine biosynthesis protein
VGNVTVKIGAGGALAFAAPAATLTPYNDALMSSALNSAAFDHTHSATVADMGIRWLLIPMISADAVLAIQPDVSDMQRLKKHAGVNGVMVFGRLPEGEAEQYEVRGLLVENGSLTEDPITGSANACLARYFAAQGQISAYRVRQGTAIQRAGRVQVDFDGENIWIGGNTVTVIDGTIQL